MAGARERLERRVAELGAKGHRAVAAGVVDGLERHVHGWSASGPPPDELSLFEIGSVTKAFTGVLLADMALRGEVRLDDPPSRHLPGRRPAWRHREPTLLELATHRTGLPNVPGPLLRRELAYVAGLRRRDPWRDVDEAAYDRLVAGTSPRRAPGGRPGYSSLAVGLLGDALAARAGMPYEQLLTERVLAPLGMTMTAIDVAPEHAARLLPGHSRRGRPRPPLRDLMPAAGGLRSNVRDMLRFLAACLEPPDDGVGPALALAQQPRARLARRVEVGLCWIVASHPRRGRVVWHNGGTWGFRSFAGFAPGRGRAAVVLSNTARAVDRTGFELLG